MAYKKYEKKEEVDYQQLITNKFIERLKEAEENLDKGLKWEKPFFDGQALPFNALTGEKYRGINTVSLMCEDRADPRWMTFNQMKEYSEKNNVELHLEKGSKASFIVKVVPSYQKNEDGTVKKNEQGQPIPVYHEDGVTPKIGFKYYPVFSCEDIKGMEPYIKPNLEVQPVEAIETLSKALQEKTGLKVEHSNHSRAYYSPSEHKVHMPNKELFKSTEAYCDTINHEFAHSTGPALGRDLTGKYGAEGELGKKYGYEELVAEITSTFMSHELGLKHDPSQHENATAYIKSWLKALENDKTMITRASNQASKATEYQMNIYNEYRQEQTLQNDVKQTPEERIKLQLDRISTEHSNEAQVKKVKPYDDYMKEKIADYIKANNFDDKDILDKFKKEYPDLNRHIDNKQIFKQKQEMSMSM
ncbi:MAG: zincin-like metallopeptidase domain-containing protein [Flavobacterium sp.]|nr:zincin-like metallopeptidase domain-containing protein [Flavobacterium sp.]